MRRFLYLLFLLVLAGPAMAEPARVLMVVTQADKMTNGKPTGLWLEEFAVPYNRFRAAGLHVDAASLSGGAAPIDPRSAERAKPDSWKEAEEALKQTRALQDVDLSDYVAVFFPGGHGTMFDFPDNPQLASLLLEFDRTDRVIAAVCHGPAVFAGALGKDGRQLVAGKRLTAFTDDEERAAKLEQAMPFLLETRLKKEGAQFMGGPNYQPNSLRSGNLVTGQNPASSEGAADLVLAILRERGLLSRP